MIVLHHQRPLMVDLRPRPRPSHQRHDLARLVDDVTEWLMDLSGLVVALVVAAVAAELAVMLWLLV